MKNVIIAGGAGLIGTELAKHLQSFGYNISILSRNPERIKDYKSFCWNPSKMEIDSKAFINQDYLINLAGESIAGKFWTKKRKKNILQSRIMSVQTLAKGIEKANNTKIKIISASAIGFYGNKSDKILDENSKPGSGFLAEVCRQWEYQADKSFQNATKIRIGIVLSFKGGYLPQIQKIVRTRLNIIMGNGKQQVSWININDLVEAIHKIMLNKESKKTYNLCSPNPVSVQTMQECIAENAKIKALKLKIPAVIIKSILGDFSELFLNSQKVMPKNLLEEGFTFRFPELHLAIEELDKTIDA